MENETIDRAIIREIHAKGGRMDVPLDLLRIGPDLVAAGFSQDQIVNALYWMVSQKQIELLSGNRVLVMKNPD